MASKAARALAQKRLNAATMRARKRIEQTQQRQLAKDLRTYFLGLAKRIPVPPEVKAATVIYPSTFADAYKESKFDPGINWDAEEGKLSAIVNKAYLNVGDDVRQGFEGAMGVTLDLNAQRVFKQEILSDVGKGVTAINETTRDTVNGIVNRGLIEGSSPHTIAGELVSSIEGWGGGKSGETIAHSRAMVVARTETAIAYNKSQVAAARQSGIVSQMVCLDAPDCGWDGHDDPELADGKVVDLDEAEANPISHPNCVRAYSPVPASLEDEAAPPEEAPAEEPVAEPTQEELEQQRLDEARFAMEDRDILRGEYDSLTLEERALWREQMEAASEKIQSKLEDYHAQLTERYMTMSTAELRAELEALRASTRSSYTISGGMDYESAIALTRGPVIQDAIWARTQVLPWAERVAFTGDDAARPFFKHFDDMGPATEAELGMRSRWYGNLGTADTSEGVAAYAQVDGGLINIGKTASKYTEADLRKVELHELLHTISGKTQGKAGTWNEYGSWAGWEEGVVERMSQLIERQVFKLGPDARTGYNTYQGYTSALGRIAQGIHKAQAGTGPTLVYNEAWRTFERKFFQDLLELRIGEREAFVKALIKRTKGVTLQQFEKEFDWLKGANRYAQQKDRVVDLMGGEEDAMMRLWRKDERERARQEAALEAAEKKILRG